jgi:phage internal scaffolding protein
MKPTKTFVRTPYNYDLKEASLATGLTCPEPSRAKQEFRDECDINRIMMQYGKTGELPQVSGAVYGDFSSTMSYHDMQNTLKEAETAFKTLPATVRAEFNNDPAQVIDFLNDPANRDKAIEIGLIDGQITATTVETPTPKGENPSDAT